MRRRSGGALILLGKVKLVRFAGLPFCQNGPWRGLTLDIGERWSQAFHLRDTFKIKIDTVFLIFRLIFPNEF